MKKSGILNADLSRIIASMGHTDKLVVCDSGLPIPHGSPVVDLALTTNVPRFVETLRVVLEELQVERVVIAEEMESVSEDVFNAVQELLPDIDMARVPHDEFKKALSGNGNVYFVRTGEATPYANIMLVSGVTF